MRNATQADAGDIAVLDAELFPANCFNERTIAREIGAGSALVAHDGGLLTGYVLVRWDWELADITRIGVRASYQRRGLGQRLLSRVVSTTQLDLVLCVEKSNSGAMKLYHEYDFKIVGQLNQHWVMRRSTL